MESWIVFAYGIYHNLARLLTNLCDVIYITFDDGLIVFRKNKLCCGPSEVLIQTNNRFTKDDASGRLDGSVDKLIDRFVTSGNPASQPTQDGGIPAYSSILCEGDHPCLN